VGIVSELLVDTVALVHYLDDTLPSKADEQFSGGEQGKNRLLLPQIALGEFVYIALRGRVRATQSKAAVQEAVQHILSSEFIALSAMPSASWEIFLRLGIPELHDRMIAAEAIARAIPLISNDPAFEDVPGLDLIWK
jgi:predicted nucleic acid-binding protein